MGYGMRREQESFAVAANQRCIRMTRILLLVASLFVLGATMVAQRKAGTGYASAPMPSTGTYRDNERGGPPANDDCANAIPLTLGADCTGAVAGNNSGATMDGPVALCDDPGSDEPDVWYTFSTGTESTVRISLSPMAGMTDWAYAIYTACDGNEVVCQIVPPTGFQETLTPNTTYWLRVFSNTLYGSPGEFMICVQGGSMIVPAANELCTGAPLQSLAVGSTITFTGDATNAADSEGLGPNSVWHSFTLATAADVTIDHCGSAASYPGDPGFWRSLFYSCPPTYQQRRYPGSYNHTECTDGRPTLCYPNLPAGTYYYAAINGTWPHTYVINITADVAGTHQPANDECAGAIALTPTTQCAPVQFSPSCASESLPEGCGLGANASDDVWYSFIATQTEMTIGVFPNSVEFGALIEAYSGNCGALSIIACANALTGNVEAPLNGLTIGNMYNFRVYNGYANTPQDDAGYGLCVQEGTEIVIGLNENVELGGMRIIPNPNDGDFSIRMPEASGPGHLEVIDGTGRTVLRDRIPASNGGLFHVRAAEELAPGLYVVNVKCGEEVRTQRLVVR